MCILIPYERLRFVTVLMEKCSCVCVLLNSLLVYYLLLKPSQLFAFTRMNKVVYGDLCCCMFFLNEKLKKLSMECSRDHCLAPTLYHYPYNRHVGCRETF